MIRVTGWTVVSEDYTHVLRKGWRDLPEGERWAALRFVRFDVDRSHDVLATGTVKGTASLQGLELGAMHLSEQDARAVAAEVGGHAHRVDREEPQAT
jgi:hypothetical protein